MAALVVAALVVLGISVAVYAPDPGSATHVVVQADGERFLYSLSEDTTEIFEGPIGTTVLEIENGEVWVARDPGPLQICVQKGRISEPDEWLACLPNEVFVRIAGEAPGGGLDARAF